MDFKTVLASAAASAAVVAVGVPAMVSFVTLQATTPGTAETGNINVTGNTIAGRFGANVSPTLARVQVSETGPLQGVRSNTDTGVAVLGQSKSLGGYFISNSTTGRGVVGEQNSLTGSVSGGLFTTRSDAGIGTWGRHLATTGTTPGVLGETLSTASNALGLLGQVTSTTPGSSSTGVRGINNGTGGAGIGVWGSQAGGGYGVFGQAVTGIGVFGLVTNTSGVGGFFANNGSGTSVSLALNSATAIRATGDIKRDYNGSFLGCVPVAYGWIGSTGSIIAGTGNFTVSKTGTGIYTVNIAGLTYDILAGDVTTATGLGSGSGYSVHTDSVSGVLVLETFNAAGALADNQVAFVAYSKNGGLLQPNHVDTKGVPASVWAEKHPAELAKFQKYLRNWELENQPKPVENQVGIETAVRP